jgi:transposase
MRDRVVWRDLLGLRAPWEVRDVELALGEGEVRIFVEVADGAKLTCPTCGKTRPGYDSRERRWRHLDTMQYRTIVVGRVPRVECPEHGVAQVDVPWAEPSSRFTALFEALTIDWLLEASFSAVARQLRLSWDEVAGIQDRAVQRGMVRRRVRTPHRIGVDETSFQKRHEYVTAINDLDAGVVLYVADDRKQASLDGFYAQLGPAGCAELKAVAMDMWPAYISATRAHVPDADRKIVFDKFHVASHLSDAVDRVRRRENRELRAKGDDRLVGTKHLWLWNPKHMNRTQRLRFAPLRDSRLRVARAFAIKEAAMMLWGYRDRSWAVRLWKKWCGWALRSRLAPIRSVARMIQRHWDGVINAATTNVTNARSEAINSKIQWIKRMACGYRNRDRFRNAIYFHLGGLNLYPASLTHTEA